MAKDRIPDPLSRRHLLERELDAAQALRVAQAYLAEGRRAEAVAFLEKAEATDELQALAGEAVEAGDVFLLKSSCAALGREPSADEWRACGDAAERSGKLRYASTARRQTGAGEP